MGAWGAARPELSSPAQQLWAAPPRAAASAAAASATAAFDPASLDLVYPLEESLGGAIAEFELPHLCDLRPHEDAVVEAWLRRWADGEELGPAVLEARALPGLRGLVQERPEVCPLLAAQLNRFEEQLTAWLAEWPRLEPQRNGFGGASAQQGAPSPEALELELHAVLALVQREGLCCQGLVPASESGLNVSSAFASGAPRTALAVAGERFCEVATGWIFKLDTVYGLDLAGQPERIAAAAGETAASYLSVLAWDLGPFAALLRCPFFRPAEARLVRLARRWSALRDGTGADAADLDAAAAAADAAADDAEGAAAGAEAEAEEETSIALSSLEPSLAAALLLELLPPPREAVPQTCAAPDELLGSCSASASADASTSGALLDDALGEPAVEETAPAEAEVPGEPSCTVGAQRIHGSSFEHVSRSRDCVLASYDEPAAFTYTSTEVAQSSLLCRNAAREAHLVGASRQLLASRTPMSWAASGTFRLDLRVLAGTAAEAAHLFEVGIAARPFAAGVHFATQRVERPPIDAEDEGVGAFFRLEAATEAVFEGVRLVVEVDFGEALARVRCLPPVEGTPPPPAPTPLSSWLQSRAKSAAAALRPPGERACPLFREHAEHLRDLARRGRLDEALAEQVLADEGARAAAADPTDPPPVVPLEYHFYVVIPAGVEVEIF
eukprot:TRINITY_DN29131_c0_g1_i1.p1 TRINITY_DN29131_c0_g1~~TRINITY_DN29131_c0_g1_i1.p1  ORF type:complete len:684 (+),score=192.01 TRINITY_DN29131_c0_g1_i1:37-2052(+)